MMVIHKNREREREGYGCNGDAREEMMVFLSRPLQVSCIMCSQMQVKNKNKRIKNGDNAIT